MLNMKESSMKLKSFLPILFLPLALYGCNQQPISDVATASEEITHSIVVEVNLTKDVTRFTELFVRFQSISNVETASNSHSLIKNAVKDDRDEMDELLEKYISYVETTDEDTDLAVKFKAILERYVDGIDYYAEGVEYNEPALTFQAFENFTAINTLLEDLTHSLGIPFKVGVQESSGTAAQQESLLENSTIKNELESTFGKDILIDHTSYEKFTSVNQYTLDEENVLSLEVITDTLDQTALESYGSTEYIYKEIEIILAEAFENPGIDKVGLTFIIDFNGTLLPTYSVSFKREDFIGLDFENNDFNFVVNFFGSDFSQANLSQSYTTVNEQSEALNETNEVMEPVIKEETSEQKAKDEFFSILLKSTQDYFEELNALDWNENTDVEKVLLLESWISEYEDVGGSINQEPEWFVNKIDATIDYYGTSMSENGDTLYVLVGSVVFQYVAFDGLVSLPFQ